VIEVRGDELKVASMLGVLGGAAGLVLSAEDETVSVVGEVPLAGGMSAQLRARLREMIADGVRTARVDVDAAAMDFGKFADWQLVNVVNAAGMNAGAPGIGTGVMIHEIWENYVSRANVGQSPYGPAHRLALGVERIVAGDITGRVGGRVAVAAFRVGQVAHYVLDYDGYFVDLTPRPKTEWPEHGKYTAQFRDRQEILAVTIGLNGVALGERIGPDRITEVIECLEEHQPATARVTGLRTGAEGQEAAGQRADAVRNAVIVALDEDDYADRNGTGIEVGEVSSKGAGADLGARRAWTSSTGDVADAPGARISIQSPR